MIIFFAWLALWVTMSQLVRDQRILIGSSRYLRIIYNPENTTSFIYAGRNGQDIYVLGVYDGKSQRVYCKRASTTQIITSPVGCDTFSNYVCENYDGRNRQRLLDNWNKSIIDCHPDHRGDCFGPVYNPGYVVSGLGPNCMIPAVTFVNPSPRRITFNVDHGCQEFETVWEFSENQRAGFRNENASLYFDNGVYGLLFVRDMTSSDLNQIQLIKAIGSPYTVYYQSVELYQVTDTTQEFIHVQFAHSNGTVHCTVNMTLSLGYDYTQIQDPPIASVFTYYLQPEVPWYYMTRSCNHYVNRLSYLKETTSTYFPVNVPIGGRPILKMKLTPSEIPIIPFKIDPQPMFQDYESGCEHFYPKSSTFISDTDVEYNRAEPVLYSCYAPFVDLELIGSVDSFTRKYDDCFRQGGTVYGLTQDVCVKHQTLQRCKRGWLYYDNYCYFKYSHSSQRRDLQSTLKEAEVICNKIGGTSYMNLDSVTVKWIMTRYLWYKTPTIRVRLGIIGQRCNCFYILDNVEVSEACDCNSLEFPLCRYHSKDYPIEFNKFHMDPLTMSILRDGQDGIPYNGREITCECEAGSTGKYCTEQTCIAPTVAAATIGESLQNPLLRFFKKCYVHGKCHNFRPFICDCLPGFGPESNLNNLSDPHHDHPCACPAIFVRGSSLGFQVDGQVYPDNTLGVCNHYKAGYCDKNTSTCKSVTALNLNYDSSQFERRLPVYEGKSLTAKVPIILIGSDIQRGFCNGHGTVCPSGERLDEQVLSTSRVDLWGRYECQPDLVQCVCDNGYDGESCTSGIPSWKVKTRFYSQSVGGLWYIQFPYILNITRVEGIDSSVYQVREAVDKPCIGCTRGQFLVYTVLGDNRPTGDIKVYDEDFPICGYHAHLYMNRFYANSAWRSCYDAIITNQYEYAKLGSTITACQCDSDHVGARCGLGISAIRYEIGSWKRYMCGSNVIPQRGFIRSETNDQCVCNSEFGFHGDACQCRHGCGKFGRCVDPTFVYGRCQFDLTAVEMTSSENAVTAASTSGEFYSYLILDHAIVLYIPGLGYWEFPVDSILQFENYAHSIIQLNSSMSVIPLGMNYSCGGIGVLAYPQRVMGSFLVMINSTSTEQWDNILNEWYPDCNIGLAYYPCVVEVLEWVDPPDDYDDVLENNYYPLTLIASLTNAVRIDLIEPDIPYGKFDCNNVMDLILESALVCLGRVTIPQCSHIIHKAALGEAYGLFWDKHDFIKFETEPEAWGDDQYRLLGSFLHEGWTDTSWDEYMRDLVLQLLNSSEIVVLLDTLTVSEVSSNSSGVFNVTGYDGNKYRGLSNETYRRINGLPGYTFSLGPDIVELRQITLLDIPVAINQVAIIAPNGKICGGVFDIVDSGQNITIRCELGNTIESEGESLYRAYYAGQLELYLNHTWEDWTVWYTQYNQSQVRERNWTVNIEFTTISIADTWNQLKNAVMVDGVFPSVDNNKTLVTSREELANLYRVYLSPRKCTNDAQCRSFGAVEDGMDPSEFTCVFQQTYVRLWLNGQDLPPVVALGDEGGCDCRYHVGIWEPTSHCILCKQGYGPLTDEDWNRYLEKDVDLGLSSRPDDCTIPVSSYGEFCGGHGTVSYSQYEYPDVSLNGWTSNTHPQNRIIPRCFAILGYPLQASSHYSVMIYGANQEIVIIDDEFVYQDGVLVEGTVECSEEFGQVHPVYKHTLTSWFAERRGLYSYWLVPR